MGRRVTKLSANLGFLWTELALPDAIRAAKQAGFEAVECHWPYAVDVAEMKAALDETGLPMLGLNTRRGDVAGGENGLAAVPERQDEARKYIDEASAYAVKLNCRNIHVMAGFTDQSKQAEQVFRDNLNYACEVAEKVEQSILIEPLNHRDASGYHLQTVEAAVETIEAVGAKNIKLMFDCYHLQINQGDVLRRLESVLAHVGHIQIAAVPDRGEPDRGELDHKWLLPQIDALGWDGYVGAEYKPRNGTDAGLGWINSVLG
jgi:hydroxypyruvate isomerase